VAGAAVNGGGSIDRSGKKRLRGLAIVASPRGVLQNGDRSDYLTVITPFMFIAMCGVQKYG
jgi:hypothetical protein